MGLISRISPRMSSTRSSSQRIPASTMRWYSWTVNKRLEISSAIAAGSGYCKSGTIVKRRISLIDGTKECPVFRDSRDEYSENRCLQNRSLAWGVFHSRENGGHHDKSSDSGDRWLAGTGWRS